MAPRNSSTESVFHFSMAISSSTSPSSSRSFKTGSAPRRYLIVRVGKESAFPLLMNACSCGHRGNFHLRCRRGGDGKVRFGHPIRAHAMLFLYNHTGYPRSPTNQIETMVSIQFSSLFMFQQHEHHPKLTRRVRDERRRTS